MERTVTMDAKLSFICPYCKSKQDYLSLIKSGYYDYDFFINSDGDFDTERREFSSDDNITEYKCPSCRQVITTSEDDATKILKGEMQPEKDQVTIY
jgi:DNA-directed RNA polymerase subunit RPC12/RpoP